MGLAVTLGVHEQTRTHVATDELRELRHRYKVAYTSYMHSVHALSDASEQGVLPTAEILKLEEQALNELTSFRHALLDELYAHSLNMAKAAAQNSSRGVTPLLADIV